MTTHDVAKADVARAEIILSEARSLASKRAWNLVVRRCQEVVELLLKAALRWAGEEIPKIHDVGPLLRGAGTRFPAEFAARIPRLASISRSLRAEREVSFYGDPESGLPPEDLYGAEDAEDALQRADEVLGAVRSLPGIA